MKFILFCIFALVCNCLCDDSLNKNITTPNPTTTEGSTTELPPLTTLSPHEPEVAEPLHFEILNSTDSTICSMFNFTATITLKTLNNTKTINQTVIALTKLNTKMAKESFCNSNMTKLVLAINSTSNNLTELQFELNHAESHYELTLISLISNGETYIKNGTLIHVEDTKSYLCLSHPEFKLTEQKEDPKLKKEATLSVTELKIDAFRSQKEPEFRAAMECQYDFPNNDFVPLAVGCALISLVFIVLIAYIVGRKRSRRLTYQSV